MKILNKVLLIKLKLMNKLVSKKKLFLNQEIKRLIPTLHIEDAKGETIRSYNLPVGAHLMIDDGDKIKLEKY